MEFINRKIKSNGMFKTIMYIMLLVLLAPIILGATVVVLKLVFFLAVAGLGIYFLNKGLKSIKRFGKSRSFGKTEEMKTDTFYSSACDIEEASIDYENDVIVDVEYEEVKKN